MKTNKKNVLTNWPDIHVFTFFSLYYRIIVTESDFQYVLQHLCHFAET